MTLKSRLVQVLRTLSLAALIIVVLAFALVQVRQHLFRHSVNLLLDDMQNLWIHPGSFEDLRRIQQRWGAFGHYDGTCTAEHCEYAITFTSPEPPRLVNDKLRILAEHAFILLGGREVNVLCGIVVRNDRIVVDSLLFMIAVPSNVEIRPPFGYAGGEIMEVRISLCIKPLRRFYWQRG